MRLQDCLAVLGTAGVTMAATVLLLTPRGVNAVATIKPVIPQPEFTAQGCVFTLKTDKSVYEAGDKPAFEITAHNPSGETVEARVVVGISASAPVSPMSRMLPVPRSLWSHESAVRLSPGETKTVTVVSEAKLPEGQSIRITLSDKKETVLANSLSVPNTVRQVPQPSLTAKPAGAQP